MFLIRICVQARARDGVLKTIGYLLLVASTRVKHKKQSVMYIGKDLKQSTLNMNDISPNNQPSIHEKLESTSSRSLVLNGSSVETSHRHRLVVIVPHGVCKQYELAPCP